MVVILLRSLSPWCNDIPDIDVTAKLHAFKIDIGTDDVKTVLDITSQNLTEGSDLIDFVDDTDSSFVSSLSVFNDSDVVAVLNEDYKTWVSVKFQFNIEKITTRYYQNIQPLVLGNVSTLDHAKSDIIGSSSLDYLNAIGSLLANGAMETSVVIRMITLKDKRPTHEKGVTTMIEKRYDEKDEQSNELNMIDVKFTQTKELEKEVNILVNSISLIVNVEFLLLLSRVFTDSFDENAHKDVESKAIAEAKILSTELAIPSTGTPNVVNNSSSLEVKLHVKKPEIYFLADAKLANTNTLIVKNNLDVTLTTVDKKICFQTNLRDIHVVTASFEKSRRDILKLM
ncbi:vacuolar protein sorting-associated protein 13-like [Xenia sp. Carnegie-2017]|uniref:vacuolar protein sorting-associated protein 13-like n=1 Tax=Xenia sp. Carnegie-2017 TaxID=2897299 RepID=UPI001F040BF3|nr:vacuolar protein sorting-associated protein 13-like [Xenia sp. Carnegie-2017]